MRQGSLLLKGGRVVDPTQELDHVMDVLVVDGEVKCAGKVPDRDEIAAWLDSRNLPYRRLDDGQLEAEVARLIHEQNVVGLHQGRMEFGPRALGSRSIVGDARSPKMQSVLNLKIKYRESFRPFAPIVIRERASAIGLETISFGIRDIILPGEMKAILNRVTEARKAAEADLITRREETAAMRSQANTARIFESNPALMRLRELEVLEKVADKANLSVILGENGLADRIVKLL